MGGGKNNDNNSNDPSDPGFVEDHRSASSDEKDDIIRWLSSSSSFSSSLDGHNQVSSAMTSWSHLTKLDLPQCGLSKLPPSFPKALPNLSILFLPSNKFQEMPAEVGACPHLQMISLKSNGLVSIHPDALQPQLRWLILTDNQISSLPSTIGRCSKLQKLMLSGNKLNCLPKEISNCHRLELARLGSNELNEPPLELLQLPNLCWVGLSNNPFLGKVEKRHCAELPVLHDLAFDSANTHNIIGQGAGGITRKMKYNDRHVAVKTFAGSMTSDGTPESERNVTLAAFSECGPSDCLIDLLGVTPPPDEALVMEFLDQVQALAQPPSLLSCSRDVYSPNLSLTASQVRTIVSKLLDIMTKLHTLAGICHGDFYSHNLLIQTNDPSQVKLSDFGAAFFYDRDSMYGSFVERIELRAFAVLVNELVMLVPKSEQNECSNLMALANACRDDASSSFGSIQFTFSDSLTG